MRLLSRRPGGSHIEDVTEGRHIEGGRHAGGNCAPGPRILCLENKMQVKDSSACRFMHLHTNAGHGSAPGPIGAISLRNGCLLRHFIRRHARLWCHSHHSWSCATSMQEAELQGWIRPLTPEPQHLDKWGCVPNTASLHKVCQCPRGPKSI